MTDNFTQINYNKKWSTHVRVEIKSPDHVRVEILFATRIPLNLAITNGYFANK